MNHCVVASPQNPPSSPLASAGVQAAENDVSACDRAVLLADSLLHRGTTTSSKVMDFMISHLECIEPGWKVVRCLPLVELKLGLSHRAGDANANEHS